MTGELGGYDDRSRLRISDRDRHQVAEVLREAAGEGRLEIEELNDRLEATYAAKVYADLVPIVADLPGQSVVPQAPRQPRPEVRYPPGQLMRYENSTAIMSSTERKGAWRIGASHAALSVMGSVKLDLREVAFSEPQTVINASAVMGDVTVVVNAGTHVSVDGVGIMGSFNQSRDRVQPDLRPDSPSVRVRGMALMGAVTVVRKPMPGELRRKWLGPR